MRSLGRRRRELAALYWDKLGPLETRGWTLPFKLGYQSSITHHASRITTSAHLMAVVAPDAETRWRSAEALKAKGIQTSLHYPYVPGFAAFRKSSEAVPLATSAEFSKRVITLPLYPTMTKEQVEAVCEALTCGL